MDDISATLERIEMHIAARKKIREEDMWRRSKPYWAADVLTLTRFIAAAAIFLMTLAGSKEVGSVLIIFGIGELTDALDGPCARAWLYPDDGQYRWWRVYAPLIDQIADIALGLSVMIFIVSFTGALGLCLLVVAAIVAITVQASRDWIEQRYGRRVRKIVVLTRRVLYVAMILGVCAWMIWLTGWDESWKIALSYTLFILAMMLAIFKRDRLTEEKAPVAEDGLEAFMKRYR